MVQSTAVFMSGFVGTDPRSFTTQPIRGSRGRGCAFRLGSPHGFFDRSKGEWHDMPTTWMSIRCFDSLATNTVDSLHKGDPVIVSGRLVTDEWMSGDQKKSEVVLQADAIGHNLNNGVTTFVRVPHHPVSGYAGARREEDAGIVGHGPSASGAGEGAGMTGRTAQTVGPDGFPASTDPEMEGGQGADEDDPFGVGA